MASRVLQVGIDEAGYGPRLGPLVVTGVAVERPARAGDLYESLAPAVVRGRPRKGRPGPAGKRRSAGAARPSSPKSAPRRGSVRKGASGPAAREPRPLFIGDSKQVYGATKSLDELERGALAFLKLALAAGAGLPTRKEPDATRTDLALARALDPEGLDLSGLAWYGGEPAELPVAADARDVEGSAARLARALAEAGVSDLTIRSRVVTARELNRAFARGLNKAEFEVEVVAGLMGSLVMSRGARYRSALAPTPPGASPHESGATSPAPVCAGLSVGRANAPGSAALLTTREAVVLADRLGGRTNYRPLLEAAFPGARVREIARGKIESRYAVEGPGGRPRASVTFACRAEALSMLVALASMVSKYVRELFMKRLNRWFAAALPALRPTAGYPVDAERFLADTAEFRARAGVAEEILVRAR